MRIGNVDERHFYEIESAKNDCSLAELKRQFDSSLFERISLSTDKDKVYRLSQTLNVRRPERLISFGLFDVLKQCICYMPMMDNILLC